MMVTVNPINRRTCLALLGASLAPAAVRWPQRFTDRLTSWLETHRRPEGGYGWASDLVSQVTPSFGAVGCYQLLGKRPPAASRVASFVRNNYPVPERRRTERPLWRLDFEQIQTLLWLDEPIDDFRPLAATWTRPAEFTNRYEMGGNPVFQHQSMAVQVRHLLNLSPSADDGAWHEYFSARRREDGTFNTTPASDGSGGHLMNTLWGLLAFNCLGLSLPVAPGLAEWVRRCQLPSGGFTYAPGATLGALDDLAYTWCALLILEHERLAPAQPTRCAAWIESLQTPDGGFQDRPGGESNPLASYYALDCLRMLNHAPQESAAPAPRARRSAIPNDASVFSMQIQAPGNGSPREAVLMARTLGIHLWAAKNSPSGWIAEAQRIADAERAPVRFAVGDEEYGTFVEVPGQGCYSHLADLVAPFGVDSGGPMPRKDHPYPWPEFRETRIGALRRGGGRMVWQFLESEELTRVLLDEATETATYSAIASFHFGNENFLHSQPFLHRWYGRIPFVGLQDAHGSESWWWGDQLAGFTTLFVAKEPTWQGWLEALDNNLVMAVRHDAITGWKTHLAGGTPALREFVARREKQWRWWDDSGQPSRRPAAALTLLRPGMPFEAGAPKQGAALRLRLWQDNTGQALPREPRAELVELRVDGVRVEPVLHEAKDDRYLLHAFADAPGSHQAEARVRVIGSGKISPVAISWQGPSSPR
ncbi:MAG: hypothetical protein KIT83_18100 [Bryobacterales bacterium]|nr:hypothetical protein [Bryobacterales bacterium]